MKFLCNIRNSEMLSQFFLSLSCREETIFSEVLLQTSTFSKLGRIEDRDILSSIQKLKVLNIPLCFEWNLLEKDESLQERGDLLKTFVSEIDSVRFIDPGVGNYLKNSFPDLKLQYSMEFQNFNDLSILQWINYFSPQIHRVILSNQFPLSEIKALRNKIPVDVELLGYGELEVFFSEKSLLKKHLIQNNQREISGFIASEDRPDQLSKAVENQHGTFIFYDKKLFLLDSLHDIEAGGVDYLRFEFDTFEEVKAFQEIYGKEGWIENLKKKSGPVTRGFLRVNRTDRPLERLTNPHLRKERSTQIGRVLQSLKNSYILFELDRELSLPIELIFISPEGKKVASNYESMTNIGGREYTGRVPAGYIKIPWKKFVVPQTLIKIGATCQVPATSNDLKV